MVPIVTVGPRRRTLGRVDLIVVSLEAWDDVWRRNQHLISRMLRTDQDLRVLYIEPPADPLHDLVSGRRPSRGRSPRPVVGFDGRLVRYRPTKAFPRRIDRRADDRLSSAMQRAARAVGMVNPVLWLNNPDAAALAKRTGWPTLYDVTDDWLVAERPEAEVHRLQGNEEWLLSHASQVVVCSPELLRRKAQRRAGSIELIPNAVDTAAYRTPRARPPDLPPASAVYVGTLHTDRLDVELCEATATALRGRGHLVLVGPNALSAADSRRLTAAGAVLLGARTSEQVIGYLQHADALVVPHRVTPFTESLDPIKLYEYAAVGRPVVATPVAGFRDTQDARVQIAAASDFVEAVRQAVPGTTRFPEGADAGVAGWDQRAEEMRAIVARLRD